MSRKQEIKVYLPMKLVGELEGRKRLGTRSRFIRDAITAKLHNLKGTSPRDFQLIHILSDARERISELSGTQFSMNQSAILVKMLQLVIDEVME